VTWAEASVEDLLVPDAGASVAWALSSVHHWAGWRGRYAGLALQQ
jgi:hypothetical protein